jgi:outer membrane protein W
MSATNSRRTVFVCRSTSLVLVGLSTMVTMAYAQQGLSVGSDRGSISSPPFLQSQNRSVDANTPGVFTGISLSVSEKLSIESYFRGNSTLSAGALGSPPRVQSYSLAGQTVMGQYRFGDDQNSFRPRLGAGLAYNLTSSDQALGIPGALHGDASYLDRGQNSRSVNGLGLALEVGASYALSRSWYLEGSVMKSFIRSSGSTLSAGAAPGLPGLKIDPLMFSFSVGFKFQ